MRAGPFKVRDLRQEEMEGCRVGWSRKGQKFKAKCEVTKRELQERELCSQVRKNHVRCLTRHEIEL